MNLVAVSHRFYPDANFLLRVLFWSDFLSLLTLRISNLGLQKSTWTLPCPLHPLQPLAGQFLRGQLCSWIWGSCHRDRKACWKGSCHYACRVGARIPAGPLQHGASKRQGLSGQVG